MEGYKTFSGIAIMMISGLVGMLGLSDKVQMADITIIVNGIVGIVGACIAIYGRIKAKDFNATYLTDEDIDVAIANDEITEVVE